MPGVFTVFFEAHMMHLSLFSLSSVLHAHVRMHVLQYAQVRLFQNGGYVSIYSADARVQTLIILM
ncbi:MAG: hypothetical protein ACKPKO_57070, partial [Candidatus Fonsibacter sp.]